MVLLKDIKKFIELFYTIKDREKKCEVTKRTIQHDLTNNKRMLRCI